MHAVDEAKPIEERPRPDPVQGGDLGDCGDARHAGERLDGVDGGEPGLGLEPGARRGTFEGRPNGTRMPVGLGDAGRRRCLGEDQLGAHLGREQCVVKLGAATAAPPHPAAALVVAPAGALDVLGQLGEAGRERLAGMRQELGEREPLLEVRAGAHPSVTRAASVTTTSP